MEAGDQQRITVVTETRNLRAQQFRVPEDQLSTGKQWEEWLEEIEREFRYFKITEPIDKKDALIIYGEKEIARLERSLRNDEGNNEYEVLRNKLNKYFLPKKNKHHARYIFLKMKQVKGETVGAYIARLREKANDCEFGGNADERILEHCIQSIENKELIRKTISKGWALDRFTEEAAHMEDTCLQLQEMTFGESRSTDNVVYAVQNNNQENYRGQRFQQRQRMVRNTKCNYCGMNHEEGMKCPAYGKECRSCGKQNHFASVCRSGRKKEEGLYNKQHKRKTNQNWNKRKVNKTTENENNDSDLNQNDFSDEDDDYFRETINHIAKIGKVKAVNRRKNIDKTVMIQIEDVEVHVEPDSGADVNVMDEYHFEKLLKLTNSNPILEKSKIKLSTLQNSLPVKGEFSTVVRNATCGTETKFVVVKGRINSPPLLSKSTLMELGMLEIKADGSFAKPNSLRMQSKQKDVKLVTDRNRAEMTDTLKEFDSVFEGIGKIRDNRNDTELYVKFNMKPGVAPIAESVQMTQFFFISCCHKLSNDIKLCMC